MHVAHAAQGEMPAKVKREFWLVVPQGDPNPNPNLNPFPFPAPVDPDPNPKQATIQDCRVVTAQETASAKCFLKIHWQDDDFLAKIRDEKLRLSTGQVAETDRNMKLEKLAVGLEAGDRVYGKIDAASDSFPINIDRIFQNQISSERISSFCWTAYDKDEGVVSVSGCAVEPVTPGSI